MSVFSIAALVCRAAPYRVVGRYIGSHTLAIYVLHIPVITLVGFALTGPPAWLADLVATSTLVDLLYVRAGR